MTQAQIDALSANNAALSVIKTNVENIFNGTEVGTPAEVPPVVEVPPVEEEETSGETETED